MKVIYSQPLTAPPLTELPPGFLLAANESELSASFGRRFPARFSELFAQLYLALRLLGQGSRPDAVVTGRYGEMFALLQSFWPFKKRAHLLLDVEWYAVHERSWRNSLNRWMHGRIIRGAAAVQVFCRVEADNYARYYNADPAKFVWIPYCADVPLSVSATTISGNGFLFSSGTHQRDYQTLLAAVRDLPIEVRIVAPVEAFAALDVPPNVRILGRLSSDQYWRELAHSRMVVLSLDPHVLRKPGVITYAGALRAGKCVVVNDPQGAASYITHGLTGFLTEPANPAALAAQIQELLAQPEQIEAAGRAAAQAAGERFAAACYLPAVRAVLERVCGS